MDEAGAYAPAFCYNRDCYLRKGIRETMLEIAQIRLPCGTSREELVKKAAKLLRLKEENFSLRITRHSVDARKKPELLDVYSVAVDLGNPARERKLAEKLHNRNVRYMEPVEYHFPEKKPEGCTGEEHGIPGSGRRPVVIGMGPAGLFCALILAEEGYRPLVLERGQAMEQRIRDVEHFWRTGELHAGSNIQFGEGGAGTFSDGKLTSNVKDRFGRIGKVLDEFVGAGAPEDIRYENLPHIGTDRLRSVIVSLREKLIDHGGEVRFGSEVTDFIVDGDRICGVAVEGPEGSYRLDADAVVLAPGHSARDTIRKLAERGVELTQKNYALGVRVSHPQAMIDLCRYGISDPKERNEAGLPAASYKLTAQLPSGRGVYSFCMCPGGYIVNASSEEGGLAVNGMSDYARDSARANSAIVVTVGKEEFGSDDPLAGMRFQEMLERRAYRLADGRIPVESYADFSRGRDQEGEKPAYSCREVSEEKAESVSGHENYREKKAESVSGYGDYREEKAESVSCCRNLSEGKAESNSGAGDLIRGESDAASSFRELSMEETERLCLKGRSAYAPLHRILPADLLKDLTDGMASFERTIPGFTGPDAWVCGLESRTSSPVRIERDGMFQSRIRGLIPCGEGAGYAGGIMSAAVDGIKAAEMAAACINHHSPIQESECQENYSKRIK